jgi:predicted transposase YbfD/YdcC
LKTIARLKKINHIEAVLQVKGNQKKLLQACTTISQTTAPYSKKSHTGKRERNRIETRRVSVFHTHISHLGSVWSTYIKAIITVQRDVQTFCTSTKQFENSTETAVYISTTDAYSATQFGSIIRSHWGIENSNHYVKDVSMHEDFSRIRKNPENVAILRSFGLNLLRMNGEKNISQALYRNAINVGRVLQYKGVGS